MVVHTVCMLSMYHGYVSCQLSWLCIMAMYHGYVSWLCIMAMYHGYVSWLCIMALGSMRPAGAFLAEKLYFGLEKRPAAAFWADIFIFWARNASRRGLLGG